MDSTKLFKIYYAENNVTECTNLISELFEKDNKNFRRFFFYSNFIPDPLGTKFSENDLTMCSKIFLAKYKSSTLQNELKQINCMIKALYNINYTNTELLEKSKFINLPLRYQLKIICSFIEMQKKLIDGKFTNKDYFTGMEMDVSNITNELEPNNKISLNDNFESLIDICEILIRYLFYRNKKLKVPTSEYFNYDFNDFKQIINISKQRVYYTVTWEQFKYLNWQISKIDQENDITNILLSPKYKNEDLIYRISVLRRLYSLIINMCNNSKPLLHSFNSLISKFSQSSFNINTILEMDKNLYHEFLLFFDDVFKSFLIEIPSTYLNENFNQVTVHDYIKCYKFLYIIANIYEFIYNKTDKKNKDITPIIKLLDLYSAFSNFENISIEKAKELIELYVFNPDSKQNGDIYTRPLIYIDDKNILFTPILITQINLERSIDKILNQASVAKHGKIFEEKSRNILHHFSCIKVNTQKIKFLAYDGKEAEFDFIGMFNNYLLLCEFKSMLTPYNSKQLSKCKDSIKYAVDQVIRRCKVVQNDWEKIKNKCNIQLPQNPIPNYRIIKIVVTNITDFTTLTDRGVYITDESTFLKFFVDPEIRLKSTQNGNHKILEKYKIWEGKEPTPSEFINYLQNPPSTSIYLNCLQTNIQNCKPFPSQKYSISLEEFILIKDPVQHLIKKEQNKHKIARNDPCPCGSGKKYKNCCGK